MRLLSAIALVGLVVGVAGCGSYTLKGRVVAGDVSYIAVVDADDPMLTEGVGVAGARVTLETDPQRLNRKVVGTAVSGPDGFLEVPFDEIGGGFLEYDAGVRVRRSGYQSAEMYFDLPKGSKRLLVVLAPGRDAAGSREEEAYDQYRRYR